METLTTPTTALTIPSGALFHPKTLQIRLSTSREEYQQLGQGLSRLDDANELWTCDFCLFGLRNWGTEDGLELAHKATAFTKGTCKKLAYIAERFTPEHRPDGFTRAHFRALLPFPQDWLNTWLPTVETRRLTSKGVRALAIEAFGSDPSQRPTTKKMTAVRIPSVLYARLVELNSTHPAALVEAILTAWLSAPPEDRASALAVAAEVKKERKNERGRARRKEKKAEKIEEPADVRYQLEKHERAQRSVRLTCTERRNQKKKEFLSDTSSSKKIVIQMTEQCFGHNTKFNDEGVARDAAVQYSKDKGYPVEASWCEACKAHHVRPAPLFPNTAPSL